MTFAKTVPELINYMNQGFQFSAQRDKQIETIANLKASFNQEEMQSKFSNMVSYVESLQNLINEQDQRNNGVIKDLTKLTSNKNLLLEAKIDKIINEKNNTISELNTKVNALEKTVQDLVLENRQFYEYFNTLKENDLKLKNNLSAMIETTYNLVHRDIAKKEYSIEKLEHSKLNAKNKNRNEENKNEKKNNLVVTPKKNNKMDISISSIENSDVESNDEKDKYVYLISQCNDNQIKFTKNTVDKILKNETDYNWTFVKEVTSDGILFSIQDEAEKRKDIIQKMGKWEDRFRKLYEPSSIKQINKKINKPEYFYTLQCSSDVLSFKKHANRENTRNNFSQFYLKAGTSDIFIFHDNTKMRSYLDGKKKEEEEAKRRKQEKEEMGRKNYYQPRPYNYNPRYNRNYNNNNNNYNNGNNWRPNFNQRPQYGNYRNTGPISRLFDSVNDLRKDMQTLKKN
jgi:hypothetical protein